MEKIKVLRKKHPELVISVDGGVKLENVKELVKAGANRLVVGSAIFGDGSPKSNFKEFIKLTG